MPGGGQYCTFDEVTLNKPGNGITGQFVQRHSKVWQLDFVSRMKPVKPRLDFLVGKDVGVWGGRTFKFSMVQDKRPPEDSLVKRRASCGPGRSFHLRKVVQVLPDIVSRTFVQIDIKLIPLGEGEHEIMHEPLPHREFWRPGRD